MKKVLFSFLVCVLGTIGFLNAQEWKDQDLMKAVREGDLASVRNLINQGANVNYMVNQTTILMEACSRGNVNMVRELVNADGIEVSFKNAHDQTALMIACRDAKNDAILKMLVKDGHANVNDVDTSGKTVLMYAVESENLNNVRFILSQNVANLNQTENLEGLNAAMLAAKLGKLPMIELLATEALGINWTGTNRKGENVLTLAITHGGLQMVKTLCKKVKGFDIDMKTGDGIPTLFWAIQNNVSANVIEYIMDQYPKRLLFETTADNGDDIFEWINNYDGNRGMIVRKLKGYAKKLKMNIDDRL